MTGIWPRKGDTANCILEHIEGVRDDYYEPMDWQEAFRLACFGEP